MYVYVCRHMCVYMCMRVCVQGTCMCITCVCDGQTITSGISLHLLPCLRQILLFFPACARLGGGASMDSPASAPPYDCESVEITDAHYRIQLCVGFRTQACLSSALPIAPSPQPSLFSRVVNFSFLPLAMMFSVSSLHGPCAHAHAFYTESADYE